MLNPSHVSCPGRRGPRVHQVLSRSACPRPETCSCRGPTSPRVGSPSPWLAEHIEKPESLHLRPQGPHTSIPGSAGPQPPCGPLRLPVTPAVGLLCPIAHQAPAATRGAQPAVTQPGRNVFFGTGPEELALALPLHTCESRPGGSGLPPPRGAAGAMGAVGAQVCPARMVLQGQRSCFYRINSDT